MSFDFSKLTEQQTMELMYPKQREAYEACRFGTDNVLCTASAGKGKSFIIEALMHYGKHNTICTGTSGVAAANIGGITTHSCLAMPLGIPTKQDLSKTSKRYKSLFKRNHPISNIIVDEVSMMGPETMDSFIQRLKRVSRTAKSRKVRCLLFGDFGQLLNVVTHHDKKYILEKYGTTKLLECEGFKSLNLNIVGLDQNKRAEGDQEFIDRLEDVRMGVNIQECLHYFNKRVGKPKEDSIFITTKNDIVDKINKSYFDANTNTPMSYQAIISGDFNVKNSRLEENLTLKEGLRVMSLVNDPTGEGNYVNGSIGCVRQLLCDQIEVVFDNGHTTWIEPTLQENKEYYVDEEDELCHRVIGTMSGFGLRVAAAVTCHKAQGIGIDKATLDVSEGAFCAGQTYVLLSRLTNIRGLTLTAPLKETDIIVDPSVKRFYAELRGEVYVEPVPKGYEQYKIRLIVAGGRDFNNYKYMCKSLDFMLKNYKVDEIIIISGKAKGADSLGERYARDKGIAVKECPANWKDLTSQPVKIKRNTYGEYNCLAGIARNHTMGDFSTHAVVYWDGISTGSKDMQNYMKELGKPVKVFKY